MDSGTLRNVIKNLPLELQGHSGPSTPEKRQTSHIFTPVKPTTIQINDQKKDRVSKLLRSRVKSNKLMVLPTQEIGRNETFATQTGVTDSSVNAPST